LSGAIQPDKLRQIWPKSHDGLLARPIYVWPRLAPLPSGEADDDGEDISGGETYAFRKTFKALYDLPLVVDDEGVPHPAVLRLATEARSPFNAAKARLRAAGAARAWAYRRMARQEPRSHLKARAHFPIDDMVVAR
jgi:Protein of unknown function (DUF3987)